MAKDRKDCLDDIAKKSGRKREEVDELLDRIDERAQAYEDDGVASGEAYQRARDEELANLNEQAALDRRAAIMDRRKDVARTRYYKDTAQRIANLPTGKGFLGQRMLAKLTRTAARLALEAKLVGVNIPFLKNRFSVDAQYVGLRRLWIGGLARDLEQGGLLKIFASRALEDKWTDELFELNRKPSAAYQRATAAGEAGERDAWELAQRGQGPGNPGITKDAHALAIAKIVQKWQRQGMAALNREGAWVRSYSGYITRSSHDADRIGAAGQEKWLNDTLPKLDLLRTFGTKDPQRVREALRAMFPALSTGDHFDYGKPIEEPLYPTPGKTAGATRELHFKTGKDWRAYNEAYGVHNATHTVVEAMRIAARRTALMKEFGTRPRAAYEQDKLHLLDLFKKAGETKSAKLGALEQAFNSPGAGAAEKEKIGLQMEELRSGIKDAKAGLDDFKGWLQGLDNRFAQIDGTSMRPINRTGANVVANIMSVQRTSKLGNLFATHFASLPSKSMEARYWGIPFAQRFSRLFTGMTQGLEGSEKRASLDATLVGFENRLGHMMNRYDVADAPAGWLTQVEEHFFKLTGVNAVIDNQRGDFEAMAAAHVGSKRGQDWETIGPKEQRVLQGFGIGEKEWQLLHGVEWSQAGGRTYLFPSDAMKLADGHIKAYLKDAGGLDRAEPSADDIAQTREQLALQLASTYSDRSGYAIPMPSARTRAILFGKDYEPGTGWNTAKKLFWQFKQWPIDVMNRAWGREIYGTIGDGRLDKVASLVETAVASVIFGVAAEGIRDLMKGTNPLAKIEEHPLGAIEAGVLRSGMGSIVGDYMLGQFDRHGYTAVTQAAGPTYGQMDDLVDLLWAGDIGARKGELGPSAWRERAATAIKMAKDNTPFMNLWLTHQVTDALIWHRLQEAINPGYLQRTEQRQRQLQGTQFLISPAKTDQFVTGKRSSPF